ncbi:MAG TPA: hypothetical protein VKO42_03830, partial [Patescibacteria group bacterium]|nr:hypothetical protein [Patescibacteria group bacterium]
SSWSSWQGPSDGTWGQALQEFFTDPGGSSEEIDEGFDGNRYFQYKAVLASEGVGGSDFPEISQVDMAYKVSTSTYMGRLYEETFTSRIFDNHIPADYGVLNWSANVPATTSLIMKVRAGDSADTGDGSWTSWYFMESSGDSIPDALDNHRYFQYQATLGTNDTGQTPTLYDVSFTRNTSALISSPYDASSLADINYLSWSEDLSGSSDAVFQLRYSANGSSWSSWCGPDNATFSCDSQSFFTDSSGSSEAVDEIFSDNQYFQYKAILSSDSAGGSDLPTINQVNMNYGFSTSTTVGRTYEDAYTSQIYDIGGGINFGISSWKADLPKQTSLILKIRTATTSDMSGATAWPNCGVIEKNTDISANNCITDGHRYLQYQVTLGSDLASISPVLKNISIYSESYNNLISSPYDSGSGGVITGVSWAEDLSSNSDLVFYLRSAATLDDLVFADWKEVASSSLSYLGAASQTSGCEKTGDVVTCDSAVIPESLKDYNEDRYFQYRLSGRGQGVGISSASVSYIFGNVSPEIQNLTATNSQGDIMIDYEVRDLDTDNEENATPGYVSPSFEYSLDGGEVWYSANSSCFASGDWEDKSVSSSEWSGHSAVWKPKCEPRIGTGKYSTSTLVRLTVDDNQSTNNTDSTTTSEFILDTKSPTPGNPSIFYIDARQASNQPAPVYLNARDDSSMYMRISLHSDFSDTDWISYSQSHTIGLVTNPERVYAQFKDEYNNTSTVETAL